MTGIRRLAAAVPGGDRNRRSTVELDPDLPVLVLWVTPFLLQHGCLGVFRTLGRAGVPVYALAADPEHAPVVRSRHLTGSLRRRPGDEDELVGTLTEFAQRLGRRPLLMCTTDDMAVWVARQRPALKQHFVLPEVAPELPGALADKAALHDLCLRHGVPTPASVNVDSPEELLAAADQLHYPVVAKSRDLRDQAVAQSVATSTLVPHRQALEALASRWSPPFRTLLQEYLPDETSEDWIVHGYRGDDGRAQVIFTGRKLRAWPPQGGATASGVVRRNPELSERAAAFCAAVDYRGVFDLDFRLDHRSGGYHLVDFNPRVGAQFRMFEDDAGVDVVRAMHLDMSGRPVPRGRAVEGERFVVEPWEVASRIVGRHGPPLPEDAPGATATRVAWWAPDDLRPVVSMVARQAGQSLSLRVRRWRTGRQRRRRQGPRRLLGACRRL